jgi:hypothetical protein
LSIPATLNTLLVSSASSKLGGGRIPESRWASIVLPEPGGVIPIPLEWFCFTTQVAKKMNHEKSIQEEDLFAPATF